jgi:preprotein translocase subunit YajC
MLSFLMLIGQATQPAGGTSSPGGSFMRLTFPLLLAFVVFYFWLFRGQRKDKQRHAQMLANLKRNDRVQTIGGVLGTVVDAREHEVVLKVDESSNVKMRFNRAAIKEVLSPDEESR